MDKSGVDLDFLWVPRLMSLVPFRLRLPVLSLGCVNKHGASHYNLRMIPFFRTVEKSPGVSGRFNGFYAQREGKEEREPVFL